MAKYKEKAVWEILSGSPDERYRMGNYPIRGEELEREGYKIRLVKRGLTDAEARALKNELNRRR